jgi:hypothetical protein
LFQFAFLFPTIVFHASLLTTFQKNKNIQTVKMFLERNPTSPSISVFKNILVFIEVKIVTEKYLNKF